MKAELLFFGFICEHNLRIVTADHVGKLFRGMFFDSKIAKKYSCSQTKTTHILSRAVAKESIFDLSRLCPLQICTNGLVLQPMGVAMKMTSFFLFLSGTLQQMVLLQHL